MDRFNDIIVFGVHGHIHKEQWNVQRDMLSKKPLRMNYIVGSVTTFRNKPPNFGVIYLEPENLLPVEYETWSFDLDKANKNGHPDWKLQYKYSETYDLKDLSP
jgi:sphingomyelin phosphodiesterase